MKKENPLIIILTIILIVIIFALVFVVVCDRNNKKIDFNKFNNEYKNLKNNSNDFNKMRKELYETVFAEVTVSELSINYSKYIEKFNDYEKVVLNMNDKSSYINEVCFGYESGLEEINKKCASYENVNKKINNLFLDDVDNFNNHLIIKYNELNQDSKLDLYKSEKIIKYIEN